MAESILMHHRRYPGEKIIHCQGDFHSRYRLGVAEKLQLSDPSLKMGVFTPVYVAEFNNLEEKAVRYRADGDVVVFLLQPALAEE